MPPRNWCKAVAEYLPDGSGADAVRALMERSKAVLADHPVNNESQRAKRPPRRFGCGGRRSMQLNSYQALYGLRGGTVSAVDLLKGWLN